jgi:hypothetical protein
MPQIRIPPTSWQLDIKQDNILIFIYIFSGLLSGMNPAFPLYGDKGKDRLLSGKGDGKCKP